MKRIHVRGVNDGSGGFAVSIATRSDEGLTVFRGRAARDRAIAWALDLAETFRAESQVLVSIE